MELGACRRIPSGRDARHVHRQLLSAPWRRNCSLIRRKAESGHSAFVQALAEFRKYGWQDKWCSTSMTSQTSTLFKTEASLLARKRQYYLAAGILRKYLPNVRVIEAVAAGIRGGVDICSGTPGYEARQADFDALVARESRCGRMYAVGRRAIGSTVFWIFALLKGRLLFWGCAANRLGGFLYWGFQPIPRRDGPVCRHKLPQPYRLVRPPCGRFFSFIRNGRSAGMWMEGRQARRRGCSASGAAALQG